MCQAAGQRKARTRALRASACALQWERSAIGCVHGSSVGCRRTQTDALISNGSATVTNRVRNALALGWKTPKGTTVYYQEAARRQEHVLLRRRRRGRHRVPSARRHLAQLRAYQGRTQDTRGHPASSRGAPRRLVGRHRRVAPQGVDRRFRADASVA